MGEVLDFVFISFSASVTVNLGTTHKLLDHTDVEIDCILFEINEFTAPSFTTTVAGNSASNLSILNLPIQILT